MITMARSFSNGVYRPHRGQCYTVGRPCMFSVPWGSRRGLSAVLERGHFRKPARTWAPKAWGLLAWLPTKNRPASVVRRDGFRCSSPMRRPFQEIRNVGIMGAPPNLANHEDVGSLWKCDTARSPAPCFASTYLSNCASGGDFCLIFGRTLKFLTHRPIPRAA